MASCFVISPIGDENSPEREHADAVFEFIIKPALDELGHTGYRADHTEKPGQITQQMYNSILNEDFCIAVLTYHNPNVFYETAVAHSAGKPVVLLVEKGTKIPFDLHNERSIFYDLKPIPLVKEKLYTKQLVANIQSFAAINWKREVPFGAGLSPLGGAQPQTSRSAQINFPAEKFYRSEDWISLIQHAQHTFHICGYGLSGWPIMPRIRESLAACKSRGCDVRIMTYDGDNPAFEHVMNQQKVATTPAALAAAFASVRETLRGALKDRSAVRSIRKGVIFQQLVFSDNKLIILPYLYSGDTGHGPAIECTSNDAMFSTFRCEFDDLWDMNAEAEASA